MNILRGEAAREALENIGVKPDWAEEDVTRAIKCSVASCRSVAFSVAISVYHNWAVIDGLPYCPECAAKKEAGGE